MGSFTTGFNTDFEISALDLPTLINSNNFPIMNANDMTQNDLRHTKSGTDPSAITYTLVSKPVHGKILCDGVEVQVGSSWTQEHIDNGGIRVEKSNPRRAGTVNFTYTVGVGANVSETKSNNVDFKIDGRLKAMITSRILRGTKG